MANTFWQKLFLRDRSLSYKIALFYLVVFGVQFVHFEGYEASIFKAAAMIAAPFLFFISKTRCSIAWGGALIYFLLIIFSLLMRDLPVATMTVGYTLGCLCAFATFHSQLAAGAFSKDDAIKILRAFIFTYTAFMLLQQIKHYTGIGYAPLINHLRIVVKGTVKYNSLFIEPSHFGRVMAVVLFAYLELKRLDYHKKLTLKDLWKNDKWVLVAGIYSLVFSGSGAAIVALGIVIAYILCNGNWQFVAFSLVLMLVVAPFFEEMDQVERTMSILDASTSLNIRTVTKVDTSAATRIGVFFAAIDNFRPQAWDFWIGQTPGTLHYHPNIGIVELYGAIAYCGVLFLLFTCCFRRLISIEIVFFCSLFTATVGNVAYVWFSMMIFSMVKYFYDQADQIKKKNLLSRNLEAKRI